MIYQNGFQPQPQYQTLYGSRLQQHQEAIGQDRPPARESPESGQTYPNQIQYEPLSQGSKSDKSYYTDRPDLV